MSIKNHIFALVVYIVQNEFKSNKSALRTFIAHVGGYLTAILKNKPEDQWSCKSSHVICCIYQ